MSTRSNQGNRSQWAHQKLYGSTSAASTDTIEVVDEEAENKNCCPEVDQRKKYWTILGLAMLVLVIFLAVGFGVSASNVSQEAPIIIGSDGGGDGDALAKPTSNSLLGNYSNAAVAADGGAPCAMIGTKVLRKNGSAVDATIATLFCNGLIASQSMGIGGGFLMTVYDKKSGKATTIDGRETAPEAATLDMYHGNATLSTRGGLAVAVPGEIRGYYEAKQRFGNINVTWASLIQPSIDMARNGIPVTFSKADALKGSKDAIMSDPGMFEVYINPATNDTWKEGDTYKRTKLADTLERIAKYGHIEFYEGKTAKSFVEDLNKLGGIITLNDLKNYKAVVKDPIQVSLNDGIKLYSVPPPGSGIILGYILNIMENYNITNQDANDPLMYHRLVESFKWGYAYRSQIGDPYDSNITKLVNQIVDKLSSEETAYNTFQKINDSCTVNDPKYYGGDFQVQEDHGTSHTSVLAPNGDAVAVTSTVNLHFGALIMSPSTGIIYNNEMDDFSSPNITNDFNLPPSPHNFIRPGKRPQSSMCPVIVVDRDGHVRIVTGAAGGTKITTATALAILHNLWLGDDIKTSIDTKRIHHQLVPMRVDYEKGFSQSVLNGLTSRGHELNPLESAGSTVSGITREKDGRVYANSDYRKAGGVDGF